MRTRQAARVCEVQANIGRYVRLGKKAGAHVFKTGALPAMRHGTAIVGATVATMRKVNKMASKVSGKTSGARSNFARQTLSGFNPGHK